MCLIYELIQFYVHAHLWLDFQLEAAREARRQEAHARAEKRKQLLQCNTPLLDERKKQVRSAKDLFDNGSVGVGVQTAISPSQAMRPMPPSDSAKSAS